MSTAQSDLDLTNQRLPRMTEQEFVDWCTSDTWAEWVDGEVILMSPVKLESARIAAFLLRLVGGHVDEESAGEVVTEPFQLRFGRLHTRRSPHIVFIRNERMNQMRRNYLEGPADLIIEVVSPESQSRDRRIKVP